MFGRHHVGPGGLVRSQVACLALGSTASCSHPMVHIASLGRLHGSCGGYKFVFPSTVDLHLCFFLSRRIEVPRIADFTSLLGR